MEPNFSEGDHVLTYNWGNIQKRSVIVFKYKGKNYIKRVEKIVGDRIYVFGDNKKLSSKIPPIIGFKDLTGRVFIKY